MNLVLLSGRLTRDPQLFQYGEANEKTMARYTLAVERFGKQEEGQQSADFISCVCYGKAAEFANKWLRQGTKIIVEGRLQSGSYTNKEGQKVYTTDVIVRSHEFAESKKAGDGTQPVVQEATPVTKPDTSFLDIPDGITEDLPFN